MEDNKKVTKKARKAAKRAEKLRLAKEREQLQQRENLKLELEIRSLKLKTHKKPMLELAAKIKLKEARQVAQEVQAYYDRTLDLRSMIEEILLWQLDQVDEHYLLRFKEHLEVIDYHIVHFNRHLDEMHNHYTERVQEMADNLKEFLKKQANDSEKNDFNMKIINRALATRYEQWVNMLEEEARSALLIEQKINEDKFDFMVASFNRKLQNIMKSHRKVYQDYHLKVGELLSEYTKLKDKDEFLFKDIKRQAATIVSLQGYVQNMKLHLSEPIGDDEKTVIELSNQRYFLYKCYSQAMHTLKVQQNEDNCTLMSMCNVSNNTIKCLENLLKKGEDMFKVAANCRKFETEEEKVTPFTEVAAEPTSEGMPPNTFVNTPIGTTQKLRNFAGRFSKAAKKYLELQLTHKELEEENICLCNMLRRVLDKSTARS